MIVFLSVCVCVCGGVAATAGQTRFQCDVVMAAVRPQGPDLLSPAEVSTLAHFSSPGWEPSAEQLPVTSAGGFWEFGLDKPPEFPGVLVLLQTTRNNH